MLFSHIPQGQQRDAGFFLSLTLHVMLSSSCPSNLTACWYHHQESLTFSFKAPNRRLITHIYLNLCNVLSPGPYIIPTIFRRREAPLLLQWAVEGN